MSGCGQSTLKWAAADGLLVCHFGYDIVQSRMSSADREGIRARLDTDSRDADSGLRVECGRPEFPIGRIPGQCEVRPRYLRLRKRCSGCPLHLAPRAGGYVSLRGQYPLGGGVEYAHDVPISMDRSVGDRGTWNRAFGLWATPPRPGARGRGAGIRGGIRLDTKALGIVDLFLCFSTDWRHGGTREVALGFADIGSPMPFRRPARHGCRGTGGSAESPASSRDSVFPGDPAAGPQERTHDTPSDSPRSARNGQVLSSPRTLSVALATTSGIRNFWR